MLTEKDLRDVLIALAAQTEPVDCSTPALRRATDVLFDRGYLTFTPPGWRYRVNDAGRAYLAETTAAAA
jgi:hypothetical protein